MSIRIYNTKTKEKEQVPASDSKKGLELFVCGPTVYDYVHLGNARTYASFDMIVKYLRFSGMRVFYLQNITDIDDKIIARAKESGMNPKDLAHSFEREYHADMESMGISAVSEYARATDYIPQIITQVRTLLDKGYAYVIEGDGVYYDISTFQDYGRLAGRTAEQADDGISRIDESVRKRNKGDFVLWKLSKEGEPSWHSPWGEGRPGWHIEDTAITETHFGPQYDIHGGARDLIFPHHEAEIAQMEAASGKAPLVKIWMHAGFLTVNGEKMAKSKGNFITARDFLEKYPARLFRLLAVKHQYRLPFDYTEESVLQAQEELRYFDALIDRLQEHAGNEDPSPGSLEQEAMESWKIAMDDDFNTPKALSLLFETGAQANALLDKGDLSSGTAAALLQTLERIDSVFSFLLWGRTPVEIPAKIRELAARREQAREQKDWKEADNLREEAEQSGWAIEDTPRGPRIKQKKAEGS